jgi:hypothetical protein
VGYEDGFMQGRQQTNFFFWYNHRSNAWTPDDPQKWGAHFDVSIADNEESQGETGDSQKNPYLRPVALTRREFTKKSYF